MTNPFNQSKFRNEHELGSAYKVVSEVHDQLDIINFLAQNLEEVRSGNIELKSDDTGKIYWKYVKSEEWILWGDMTEWFAPLVEELQQGQANHSDSINNLRSQLNTLDQKLDADINALGILTDTVQTDRTALDTLSLQVAQNTQDILTIQSELQTLISTNATYETRLDSLENTISDHTTRLADIESRLEDLENA